MSLNISQSKLKTWRSCRKAYHYKYGLKITKKHKSYPFLRGEIIHDMMEQHYLGKKPWAVFRKHMKANERIIRINPEEYGDMENQIKLLMKGYFAFYKNEKLKPLMVEHEFRVKLMAGVYLTGKIDMVARESKMRWLMEHKCHNIIPSGSTVPYTNIQSSLYKWAYEKEFGKPVEGIMWNYLWGKQQSIPQLLKNGEMSKRSTSLTWAMYKKALIDNDLDPADYQDMKEKLEGNELNFYQRKYLPVDNTMVGNIIEDTKTTAKEIMKYASKDQTRNLGRDCDYCEFKNLCLAQLKGLDHKFILKSEFKERKKDEKQPKKNSKKN